ncbi:hypothetical protein [Alcaligenes endophyticus]|uniref:Uncharacterized protein n=1 Tax=Alcaligenes endophyticus TaxID=1929088 RepID=A0ABT8EK56_9BURK|nr:hypothetical protein [Alcaligenes endophyticus]MCX5591911.1 hypothetical protein [Alcaligenes endophyticus]MDN4121600.1 hypothetical protein [Alcaligenes endophyticus]
MTNPLEKQASNEDPKPEDKASGLGEFFSLESVTAIPKDYLRACEQPSVEADPLEEQSK